MNFECLTEAEVRRKYQDADDKAQAIEVISGLTCSSKREVKMFLGLYVEPEKPVPRKNYVHIDTAEAGRLYDAGLNDVGIANVLGVTKQAVGQWRRGEGLPANRTYKTKPCEEDKRMELYHMGLSDAAIGRIVGVEKKAINLWRRRRGLAPNRPYKKKGQEE